MSCVTRINWLFLLRTIFRLCIKKTDDQALSDKFQISLYVNGALGVFPTTIPMTRINWLFFALSRLFVDDNGRVNIDWSQWLIEARHLGTQWLNCMCTMDLNEHLIVGFISNQICLVNRKKNTLKKALSDNNNLSIGKIKILLLKFSNVDIYYFFKWKTILRKKGLFFWPFFHHDKLYWWK